MKKLFLVLTLLIASTLQSFATTPGTLAVDTQIPLVMDGKTVGSMTLKAGSEVSINQVLPTEDSVLISRGDSTPVSRDTHPRDHGLNFHPRDELPGQQSF